MLLSNDNFLNFLVAKSHLNLTSRENKVVDLFFKLHGNYLLNQQRSKVNLSQAGKMSFLSSSQVSQALNDLLLKNLVIRVKAKEVETEVDGGTKHSIAILEKIIGNPVYAAVYDKVGDVFFCLNYRSESWAYAKDVPISSVVRKFSIKEGKQEEVSTVNSLAKKALDYFCTKFIAKYQNKFSVHPGTIKEFIKLVTLLQLRELQENQIFNLIDFSYERKKNMKAPMLPKYITEDFDLFVMTNKAAPTSNFGVETDIDGQTRIKK